MTGKTRIALCAAIAAPVLLILQTNAQIKKGKERPLTTKHMMAGLILPNSGALGKALQGEGPKEDKAWDQALMQAELLNESSHIMMADGRCPDEIWASACRTMREGSATLIRAIEAKKLEEARAALAATNKSCGECHKTHKK